VGIGGYSRGETSIFLLAVVLAILPIWLVDAFPSQDGPIHLWILHLLGNPDGPAAREFLEVNRHAEPNLLFYGVAYPFARLAGVFFAEKVFLTLYALVFCFGARYAVLRFAPESGPVSFLVIPLCFNYFVHMGFYNYIIGTALFLPALALAVSWYRGPPRFGLVRLGLLALLMVLAHLVAFVVFAFSLGILVATDNLRQGLRSGDFPGALARLGVHAGRITVAFLPALAVAAWFFDRYGAPAVESLPVRGQISQFARMQVLASFDALEVYLVSYPYALVLAVLGGVAFWHGTRLRAAREAWFPLAVVGGALFLVYAFLPLSARGVPANPRLTPFLILLGILWLSTIRWATAWRWVIPVASILIVGSSTAIRAAQYRAFDVELREYNAVAARVEPGSTLFRVRLGYDPEARLWREPPMYRPRVEPFLHVLAHTAIRRDAIYVGSTLMSPSVFGYFPLVYRNEMDPFSPLRWQAELPYPELDFDALESALGRPVDYLVVLGDDWKGWVRRGDRQAASYTAFHHRYGPVTRSPAGQYQLWRYRPAS
jgi:hypothetical protein